MRKDGLINAWFYNMIRQKDVGLTGLDLVGKTFLLRPIRFLGKGLFLNYVNQMG